jgi:hypothetical protein
MATALTRPLRAGATPRNLWVFAIYQGWHGPCFVFLAQSDDEVGA